MSGLPIMLRLDGRPVLVVGGGAVAAAKATLLRDAGAAVTMVAPHFDPAAHALSGVERVARAYRPGDLDGCWLVVTAVDDTDVTATVAADADAARVFCNAADRPVHCSATLMATHRSGDITVAVSTGGRSPAGASWLRNRLAAQIGPNVERVVQVAAQTRDRVRRHRSSEGLAWMALLDELAVLDGAEFDDVVERFVQDATGVGEPGLAGSPAPLAAGHAIPQGTARLDGGPGPGSAELDPPLAANRRRIAPSGRESTAGARGRVLLVGAGPGDADLLTVAAVRALAEADVVVHDALVGDGVMGLIPSGAERIDVGKRPGAPVAQELISTLLVQLARSGRNVVRLKGGDPYLFGRGGEEALALRAAGIDVAVVPGITSALAAPALAGVPVTQRGMAAAVTVITGHRAASQPPVDWEAAARLGGTLVVLMGVTERAAIAAALQRGGLAADTPVAVIERASLPDARVRRCTLDALATLAVQAPATLVIGAVADLDLRSPPTLAGAAHNEREQETRSGRPAERATHRSGRAPGPRLRRAR